ncbi:putative amidase [Colletotrichum sublineola]|uniref:Putative amidase n=1 Tax=Colletotrichum sublineola TaxID=1173701 RepID=A0A066XX63_COLSU|nr:putative amidase [Colletotrichum sublineola]
MMTADSENNIFGRTLNPRKTSLTAGGSTGGEGALVAFRGSVLGMGSDIAGSVRIPSLCCGVYGFKPTADRIPYGGELSGQLHTQSTTSPFSWKRRLRNALGSMTHPRSIHHGELWVMPKKTFTVGVLPEDPNYPLHPPVRRALDEAVSSLEAAGHTIIRLPVDPSCGASLGGKLGFTYYGLISSDLDALESEIGEPLVASVRANVHPFGKDGPLVSRKLDTAQRLSEFLKLRDGYADSWRETWLEYKLDVVLGPGAISTAVPHDTYGVPVYTVMWNVLDYPAGIIPYGFASKDKDPQYQKATAQFDADYDPDA